MDAWSRASAPEERSATIAQVTAAVQRLPRAALVGSLQAMGAQRASLGYGADIERILAQRLGQIRDHQRGRGARANAPRGGPSGVHHGGDAGTALGELAASRRGLNIVEGRTLGLLLPTESPGLRDESADVLRGVLWALGLPRGLRVATADAGAADAPSTSGAAARGTGPATCAPLEPAPDSSGAHRRRRGPTRDARR